MSSPGGKACAASMMSVLYLGFRFGNAGVSPRQNGRFLFDSLTFNTRIDKRQAVIFPTWFDRLAVLP